MVPPYSTLPPCNSIDAEGEGPGDGALVRRRVAEVGLLDNLCDTSSEPRVSHRVIHDDNILGATIACDREACLDKTSRRSTSPPHVVAGFDGGLPTK